MRFGFHISIAGGFSKVVERANVRGCETIQFFSRNPRGWKYSPLNKEDVKEFQSSLQSSALFPVLLHMPYLPNIASLKSKFYKRSIHSIATGLQRGAIGSPVPYYPHRSSNGILRRSNH
jgi:deoxyribonuclease-4